MTTNKKSRDIYAVPAVSRSDLILKAIASTARPLRISSLIEITGLPRSTMYILIETLENLRFIEKSGEGYIIGVRLFELGSAYAKYDGLQSAFRQAAIEFVAAHNEVVQIAVLDRHEVVYLAREDSNRPVRLVSDIGSRLPAHCSALGKALLASLDDNSVQNILPEDLFPSTEYSITRRDVLIKSLEVVRRTGLAFEREEATLGLACFAAFVGVTPLEKRVAVSTSIPVNRLDSDRERQLATAIQQMATQIRKMILVHE